MASISGARNVSARLESDEASFGQEGQGLRVVGEELYLNAVVDRNGLKESGVGIVGATEQGYACADRMFDRGSELIYSQR